MSINEPVPTVVDFGAIADAAIAKLEGVPVEPITPAAPATPAVVPAVTPAPEAKPDVFDDATVQSFDREYVHGLREEAAANRVARKEAEDALSAWSEATEGWSDDDQSLARDLLAAIRQGDLATAVDILGPEALAEVLGTAAAPGTAPVAEPVADAPLTRADLDRTLAEREATRQRESEITATYTAAKALGYDPQAKPGTPEFGEWVMVVQYAQAKGSLEEGHKALQEAKAVERQRVIDEYVGSRSNGSPAPVGSAGAVSRNSDEWPTDVNPLAEAQRRAMERVTANRTQIA